MTLSKIKKVGVFSNSADSEEIVARAKHVNPIIDEVNAMTDGTGTNVAVSSLTTDTISETTSAAGVTVDGVLLKDSTVTSSSVKLASAYGTAGTSVTMTEYGDGRNITTVLSFTDAVLGAPTAGGNSAHGKLIYTFPDANLLITGIYVKVGLTVGSVTTDTPDVGLGTAVATGAVATLDGTGTFEDIITGQTWNKALDGTSDYFGTLFSGVVTEATTVPLIKVDGAGTELYLNAADGWNAGVTGNLTATGYIGINYILIS